jgi:hypothetical protein
MNTAVAIYSIAVVWRPGWLSYIEMTRYWA